MGKITIHFEIEGIDVTDVPEIRTNVQMLWNNVLQTHENTTLVRNSINYEE